MVIWMQIRIKFVVINNFLKFYFKKFEIKNNLKIKFPTFFKYK